MDSEKVPIFAGQASSETGRDEQPLYYDKTNHPILVRNSAVCVCVFVLFLLFTRESDGYSNVPPAVASVAGSYLCVASVSVHVVSELLGALNGWSVLALYALSWSALV